MDKDVDVAQVSLDLVEGDVFRVAAIVFKLHLTDDLVQRRVVGDTCLFVAADHDRRCGRQRTTRPRRNEVEQLGKEKRCGRAGDLISDLTHLPRFATQSVRPEGLATICAVQQPLVDPDVIDAHLLREKKHL